MKNSRTHLSLYLTFIDCNEVKKRLVNSSMLRYSCVEILRKDYLKILILKNGILALKNLLNTFCKKYSVFREQSNSGLKIWKWSTTMMKLVSR